MLFVVNFSRSEKRLFKADTSPLFFLIKRDLIYLNLAYNPFLVQIYAPLLRHFRFHRGSRAMEVNLYLKLRNNLLCYFFVIILSKCSRGELHKHPSVGADPFLLKLFKVRYSHFCSDRLVPMVSMVSSDALQARRQAMVAVQLVVVPGHLWELSI
jgi:hypothetical protein